MLVGAVLGLIAFVAIASGLLSLIFGFEDEAMQYDWHTERWVFIPDKNDKLLEMLIKSM